MDTSNALHWAIPEDRGTPSPKEDKHIPEVRDTSSKKTSIFFILNLGIPRLEFLSLREGAALLTLD